MHWGQEIGVHGFFVCLFYKTMPIEMQFSEKLWKVQAWGT